MLADRDVPRAADTARENDDLHCNAPTGSSNKHACVRGPQRSLEVALRSGPYGVILTTRQVVGLVEGLGVRVIDPTE